MDWAYFLVLLGVAFPGGSSGSADGHVMLDYCGLVVPRTSFDILRSRLGFWLIPKVGNPKRSCAIAVSFSPSLSPSPPPLLDCSWPFSVSTPSVWAGCGVAVDVVGGWTREDGVDTSVGPLMSAAIGGRGGVTRVVDTGAAPPE